VSCWGRRGNCAPGGGKDRLGLERERVPEEREGRGSKEKTGTFC